MKTERVLKKNAIKAYKAFNSDLTCKGFQYEVGKEYHHKGKLELCKSGFHACERLADCFKYYRFSDQETRVAEVLVWGSLAHDDGAGSKLCASNIKIVRELAWSEVLLLCNSGNHNTGCGNSGDWNSGNNNSGNHNTGCGNSGHSNSGYWNSGNQNTGYGNSGNNNSGNGNSGDRNSGNNNSGNGNSGHSNSGNGNSGHSNSGYWNIGSWNSGDCNSGNRNSGNNNTGNGNSGYWNSGSCNSGNWNSGNWNSGYLNTSAQKYTFIFNKQVEKSVLERAEFPSFMFFALTEWVPDRNMSQVEKERHPEYVTTGGYLKKYAYKTAFRKSFEKAKRLPDWLKQRQKLLDLPNFDAKVFEEISGIKSKELGL